MLTFTFACTVTDTATDRGTFTLDNCRITLTSDEISNPPEFTTDDIEAAIKLIVLHTINS